jgi:hypothetical protein
MGNMIEESIMRATRRRVERLERAIWPSTVEPTAIVYVPYNGRGDAPPGRYRVRPAMLVVYESQGARGQGCPGTAPGLQPGNDCP